MGGPEQEDQVGEEGRGGKERKYEERQLKLRAVWEIVWKHNVAETS